MVSPEEIKFATCKVAQVPHPGKVGSELASIIPTLFASKECDCQDYAAKMDRWGIAGCEQRFEEIANHLVAQANKKPLLKLFPAFNRVVAVDWLTQAIAKARDQVSIKANERFSVVWVYWAAGAEGDELRYSLRSAAANVLDASNFVVCGDVPAWFQGDGIHSPRVTKDECRQRFGSTRWQKWVDSITKLRRIIESPLVTERFLWLYDDTFIVRSTTVDWLSVPRAGGDLALWANGHNNKWRACLSRTVSALQARNLPTRNYSTHYPVVYEKSKLREVLDEFECDFRPRAIESLYCNRWFASPASISKVFQYNKAIEANWSVHPHAIVVNVGGFKPPVARAMERLFPMRTIFEA